MMCVFVCLCVCVFVCLCVHAGSVGGAGGGVRGGGVVTATAGGGEREPEGAAGRGSRVGSSA